MNATEIQKHWNDRIEAALQPLRDLMAEMLREHVARNGSRKGGPRERNQVCSRVISIELLNIPTKR
jgi:hypothetical protein